jgi:hypothetical protein
LALAQLEAIGYERADLHASAGTEVHPAKFRFEPTEEQNEDEMMAAMDFGFPTDEGE